MLLVLCDSGFVFKQLCSAPQNDIEHLRCKLSRLKRAGALYETGSDSSVLLGDKWVRVQTAVFSSRRRT